MAWAAPWASEVRIQAAPEGPRTKPTLPRMSQGAAAELRADALTRRHSPPLACSAYWRFARSGADPRRRASPARPRICAGVLARRTRRGRRVVPLVPLRPTVPAIRARPSNTRTLGARASVDCLFFGIGVETRRGAWGRDPGPARGGHDIPADWVFQRPLARRSADDRTSVIMANCCPSLSSSEPNTLWFFYAPR